MALAAETIPITIPNGGKSQRISVKDHSILAVQTAGPWSAGADLVLNANLNPEFLPDAPAYDDGAATGAGVALIMKFETGRVVRLVPTVTDGLVFVSFSSSVAQGGPRTLYVSTIPRGHLISNPV